VPWEQSWAQRCHWHLTSRRRGTPASSALAGAVSPARELPTCGAVPPAVPGPSGIATAAAASAVSVRLPGGAVSTREVTTREMMNCKSPASGSSQPGPGPGEPTGNVSTRLGCAGLGPAGGSSASDTAPLHLGGDVLWVVPRTRPAAETAGKGDGEGP